jgi:biopolymer transport protein ExbD
MGMSAGGHGEKAVPYINVTPLIDVLLVLLIIFMVVTPLKPSRFKTLIPEPPKPDEQQPTKAYDLNLRVDVMKDEKLQLNGEEIGTVSDTSKLSQRLQRLFEDRTEKRAYKPGTEDVEKTVYIKAPRSINYGRVAIVIDAVKGAGAAPVGLQVDQLEQ